MVRNKEFNSRLGEFEAIRSMVHFRPDEIIEHFTSLIQDAQRKGMEKKPYVKHWRTSIDLAMHFKNIDIQKTA